MEDLKRGSMIFLTIQGFRQAKQEIEKVGSGADKAQTEC